MLERNNQRIQEIQEHMVWPSITDIDQKAYIPEVITRYKNIYPYGGSTYIQGAVMVLIV